MPRSTATRHRPTWPRRLASLFAIWLAGVAALTLAAAAMKLLMRLLGLG